jgi:hypothetical protein
VLGLFRAEQKLIALSKSFPLAGIAMEGNAPATTPWKMG